MAGTSSLSPKDWMVPTTDHLFVGPIEIFGVISDVGVEGKCATVDISSAESAPDLSSVICYSTEHKSIYRCVAIAEPTGCL
jgi:hypothetical protein